MSLKRFLKNIGITFWRRPKLPGVGRMNRSTMAGAGRIGIVCTAALWLLCISLWASAQTVTRGPYLQTATPVSVVVRWRTDTATNSRVCFGPDPGSLTSNADVGAQTTEHGVTLFGLVPNTKYYYSVGTTAKELSGGPNCFFITPPPVGTAKPTRIWVIGDAGRASPDQRAVRDAYYSFAGGRHTDLWLMLGDNAYNDGTDDQYQAAVFDIYGDLLRKSPVWPTFGNHDAHSASSVPQSGVYYDIFTLPTLGQAGGLMSGTEAYYSFEHANIHSICLNSEDVDRTTNGLMLKWLKADLAANHQDWTIAYWHHPPYSKGSHDTDSDKDSEGRMHDMRVYALPILEDGGVDLILCGHSHAYERSFLVDGHYDKSMTYDEKMIKDLRDGRSDGQGAYHKASRGPAPHEGTVYVVAGSGGQVSGGKLTYPAMYNSLNVLGSVVLDFSGSRLEAMFLDERGSLRDRFAITKGAVTGSQ